MQILPEEKSDHKAAYERQIDALPFSQRAYMDFHAFVENVVSIFGFEPSPLMQFFPMTHGDVIQGQKRTLALVIQNSMNLSGYELYQTEDRRIGTKPLRAIMEKIPKLEKGDFNESS